MKNILIVAATLMEIVPFLEKTQSAHPSEDVKPIIYKQKKLHYLITGIGMTAMSCHLSRHLAANTYDCVINAGIAGTFNKDFNLSKVVEVRQDIFAELGTENPDGAIVPLTYHKELDNATYTMTVENNDPLKTMLINNLPKCKGITVSTVSGSSKRIKLLTDLYKPDVESMEGAAFLYVCNQFKQKSSQIRALSNYVEVRNKKNWAIKKACNNLSETLDKIVEEL